MNISKFLFYFLVLFNFSIVNVYSVNHDQEINLDDEELPAIDPFQSSSGVSAPQGSTTSQMQSGGSGILGGFRLVGTIVGETESIAILSSPEGSRKFSENSYINDNVFLDEVKSEFILIKSGEQFFEVYFNNIIKPSEG
ncbi:hypothetical protein IDH09_03225 [Pelagibacterales bacterium SAG-MED28]|nr:hypothetical protein [Pelagibacterales bacterium SAG-MED28]|tara:strand:- start:981 stop:1397 length:417 start_codon:yes stop_codon:yes gene_type:complete